MGKALNRLKNLQILQRLSREDEASFHFCTMASGVIQVWRASLETFSTSDPKLLTHESKNVESYKCHSSHLDGINKAMSETR